MRSLFVFALCFVAGLSARASGQTETAGAHEITGQVRLGGQPAPAGVSVALQIVSGRFTEPSHEPVIVRTVTDSKGMFTFNHLETVGQNSGREFFAVSAQSAGYGRAFQVIDLTLAARGEATLILQRETRQREATGGDLDAAPSGNARRPANPQAQQALDRAQELLFRKHDPEGSIDEFKKAVKSDPWYGPGYILLGLAYMQTQRWSDAQFAFTEASKVEPGNAQAFLGLGSALNEQHDYAGARKALEHSLELNPDSAEAHYELARTLGALGKWQEAEPHASRAIEINPDYAGPHALMGNIYLEQQNLAFALAEFRAYLRLDPQGSLAPAVRQIIPEIEKAIAQEGEKHP
jgi:tetratricopeptide (TPR) repeat protein